MKSILLACAALVHHICSVVSRQLAESIIAVNDWPLQDLCISQQEACFWDKIQEILNTKLQIKKTCNKTYTFYYLSNRHTLLNHHNASLYLLLHIMETRCKSHPHLSTRWDGEKKSCLGSTHNANQILMKSWKLLPLYCSFRAVCSLQTKGWLKFFQIKLHTWTYCTCCSFCGLLWSDIQTIETEFQITTTLLRWRVKFTDTESMLHPSIYVCKKSLWVSWE